MKSDNYRESNQEKKQRVGTKNEAKKIKSDDFKGGDREIDNWVPIIFSPNVCWIVQYHCKMHTSIIMVVTYNYDYTNKDDYMENISLYL